MAKMKVGDFVRNRFTREVGRIVSIPRKGNFIVEYCEYHRDRQTPEHFERLEVSYSPRTISTIQQFQTLNAK